MRLRRKRYSVALLCLLGISWQARSAGAQSPAPLAAQPQTQYRLQLSDSLEVNFPFSPEYNQLLTVLPDGKVSLKEVGQLQALGLTLPELEGRIAQAYTGVLREPKVSVGLKDYQRPSYYASGEVGKPGRYDLRANTSLLQALSEAGGLINERAQRTQVIIFRPHGDGTYETTLVDVKSMLVPKQTVLEVYTVHAGDIVYVPQNRLSKVQRYIPSANIGSYISPGF